LSPTIPEARMLAFKPIIARSPFSVYFSSVNSALHSWHFFSLSLAIIALISYYNSIS